MEKKKKYSGLPSSSSTTRQKHIWGLFELKKLKIKRIEATGGERAEKLEQADTKCCQILYNPLNWEATLALNLKNTDFMLRGATGKFLDTIEIKCSGFMFQAG